MQSLEYRYLGTTGAANTFCEFFFSFFLLHLQNSTALKCHLWGFSNVTSKRADFLDARREMLAKHGSVWARGDHLRHPASIFLSGTLQAGEATCEAASSSWRLAFGVQQTLPRHRAVWLYDLQCDCVQLCMRPSVLCAPRGAGPKASRHPGFPA